jgi:hypothetical protein
MSLDVSIRIPCAGPFSDLLAASDPNYHKYEDLLSPGWIPGRKIVCSITDNRRERHRLIINRTYLMLNTTLSEPMYRT